MSPRKRRSKPRPSEDADEPFSSDHERPLASTGKDSSPERKSTRPEKAQAGKRVRQGVLKSANETRTKIVLVKRKLTEYRRFFFLFGIILGTALTFFAIPHIHAPVNLPHPLQQVSSLFSEAFGDIDLSEYLPDMGMPGVSNFDFWGNVTSILQMPALFGGGGGRATRGTQNGEAEQFLPGARLAEEGLGAKHPVILIPGIVSTGLEVWNTGPKVDKDMVDVPTPHHKARNLQPDQKDTASAASATKSSAPPPSPSSSPNSAKSADAAALDAIIAANRACGQKYFRKRIWGTTDHLKSMLLNNACWIYHMMLDEKTGMDPPGVKLRAAQGLDAADYLFPGFWVWAKLISNLGALGYDSNNMHLASYDWRLSLTKLEIRDRFFTKLKSTIEITYEHAGGGESARVVLVSHSMGATVVLYFMNWIKGELGHQNGDAWCAQYLQGWVNIAGTLLGVPKSVASMLSGEMKDTAQLNGIQAFALENYLMPKAQRARLFRSWGGIASMIPYGGDTIWGKKGHQAPDQVNATHHPFGDMVSLLHVEGHSNASSATAPGDADAAKVTYAAQVHHTSPTDHNASAEINSSNTTRHDFSANATLPLILAVAGDPYWKDTHVWNVAQTKKELRQSKHDKRSWTNPLVAPLPSFGPHFKIYCLYGTGLPTERKYFYRTVPKKPSATTSSSTSSGNSGGSTNKKSSSTQSDPSHPAPTATYASNGTYGLGSDKGEESVSSGMWIKDGEIEVDTGYTDRDLGIISGVQMAEGDGTVPLMSLGYMCVEGWKHQRYNPNNVTVITREFKDQPAGMLSARGGPGSADHVDRNYDLTEDILRIVGGWGHHLSDRVDSPVREMASRVHLPEGLD